MQRSNTAFVGFEIFTAVTANNAVFWEVAPCRSCVNRRFGRTYRLHLQGRKILEQGTSVSRWLTDWVLTRYAVFWDVGPCRSCVNRRFGRTYRLHLQGRKILEQGTSVSRWLTDWALTRYGILQYNTFLSWNSADIVAGLFQISRKILSMFSLKSGFLAFYTYSEYAHLSSLSPFGSHLVFSFFSRFTLCPKFSVLYTCSQVSVVWNMLHFNALRYRINFVIWFLIQFLPPFPIFLIFLVSVACDCLFQFAFNTHGLQFYVISGIQVRGQTDMHFIGFLSKKVLLYLCKSNIHDLWVIWMSVSIGHEH
jgi:hypothetical protein